MLSIPPSFELIGELLEFDYKEPTDETPKPAGLAYIKYGSDRGWRNDNEINFINEVYVRIPFGAYIKNTEKFFKGQVIRIKGRLQCIQKFGDDAPRVELMAEKITFLVEADT